MHACLFECRINVIDSNIFVDCVLNHVRVSFGLSDFVSTQYCIAGPSMSSTVRHATYFFCITYKGHCHAFLIQCRMHTTRRRLVPQIPSDGSVPLEATNDGRGRIPTAAVVISATVVLILLAFLVAVANHNRRLRKRVYSMQEVRSAPFALLSEVAHNV
jgi:hypothetical protein